MITRVALRTALALLCVASCKKHIERNQDLVPIEIESELSFAPRRITLQPDDGTLTFTLPVPTQWEQDKNLVKLVDGREWLVNGAGEILHDFRYETSYGDPGLRFGHFELGISCEGACAKTLEAKMFSQYSSLDVIDETKSDTDHMLVVARPEGGAYVLRVWWPPGESSFRSCWVFVSKKFEDAAPAFEKACAAVKESFRP